ncbi:hypothetical protein [Schlesneria paludicola]|uniref:hypothetical protein n=1 Tax=Schlesneria paludicola TaxID=360056 RepID=UPI0002F25B35|nr:hypothetical protein [Schlesneria paludicola]
MSTNLNSKSGVIWGQITPTTRPSESHSNEQSPLRSLQENFVSFASLTILVGIICYLILR